MSNSLLAAAGALAALAFASSGHAAVVPIEQHLDLGVPPGITIREIAAAQRHDPPGTSHHELIAEHAWMETRKPKKGTAQPPGLAGGPAASGPSKGVSRHVAPRSLVSVSSRPAGPDPLPFHEHLIGADAQPIEIGPRAPQDPVAKQVSAVPLPGAIWLFGSALLAFLGISSRRSL